MDIVLTFEGPQTLPWPIADATVGRLTLRHCLAAAAPDDDFFLLCEARRILRPGGVLRVVPRAAGAADRVSGPPVDWECFR